MENKFKIEDEKGILRDAKLITIIEVEKTEYAIYSIDRDEENTNIFVSRIEKDDSGKDVLVNITDDNEKKEIDNIVKEVVKQILNGGK